MIGIVWKPSGPPSRADQLAELAEMREKCRREWHLDEEYYAAQLKYIERAEAALRRDPLPGMEAMRQRAAEAARELAETQPLASQVIAQRLKDQGHKSWQVDKLIAYASFIQARGWEAFYPEDAAFLKQKYAEAGVDPEKIDFHS